MQTLIQWLDLVLFFGLTATICGSISLMFLPAIMELRKPRDAGPRLIIEYNEKIRLDTLSDFDDEGIAPNQLAAENPPSPLGNFEDKLK